MVDHGTSWDFNWYSKNGDHPGTCLLISAARCVFFLNWGSLGFLKLEINWDINTYQWNIPAGWWCNNHLEKYEFVNGKDDFPCMKWKIKNVIYIYNIVSYYIYMGVS